MIKICDRITALLDKEIAPSVNGVTSLLGAGRQSILRTKENIALPRTLTDYCTRKGSMPLIDPITRKYAHNIGKNFFF